VATRTVCHWLSQSIWPTVTRRRRIKHETVSAVSVSPQQPSQRSLTHHLHSTLWIALLHIRSLSVYSQYSLRSSKLIEIHFPISSFDIYIADLIYWPCANRKKHLAEIRKWHIYGSGMVVVSRRRQKRTKSRRSGETVEAGQQGTGTAWRSAQAIEAWCYRLPSRIFKNSWIAEPKIQMIFGLAIFCRNL